MELRIHRENENKLHEYLYNNLKLLSEFYPTSSYFNAVFKKDMFVKSNKAAFFEVVYYLLSILSPEQVKEKITTWPPYDIKGENTFRKEVLTYMNELNVLYDHANIPQIMHSHLISPGGFKFTKFMLKLSELVMFEHLKKFNKVELYCPDTNDNVDFHKMNLKKQISSIKCRNHEINRYFISCHVKIKAKAEEISKNLSEINKNIVEEKKKNYVIQENFKKQYPLYPTFDMLHEKTEFLYKEWSNLQPIHELIGLCGNLCKYLDSNSVILEHKTDEFKVPKEIIHIVKDNLDLIEFFQGLNIVLENQALELPNISNSFMNSNIEKIHNLSLKYIDVCDRFLERRQDIQRSTSNLCDIINLLEDLRD